MLNRRPRRRFASNPCAEDGAGGNLPDMFCVHTPIRKYDKTGGFILDISSPEKILPFHSPPKFLPSNSIFMGGIKVIPSSEPAARGKNLTHAWEESA